MAQKKYTVLSGSVYDGAGGPLGRGVYWVKGTITVPKGKTLTIKPQNGFAILKFDGGGIDVYGRLVQPNIGLSWAVYTSLKDDMQGGDTNGDGSRTIPAPGDWRGIHFQWGSELSAGSSANNAQFWYGGNDGRGMIFNSNYPATKLTINNCKFRFGKGVGLNTGFSEVTASRNSIENCTGFAWQGQFPFLHGVQNNTAAKNKGGDFIRRMGATAKWPTSPFVLTRAHSLSNSGVFVMGGTLQIPKASALTVKAGLVLKFQQRSGIYSPGGLTTQGTAGQRVVFTTLDDDSIGGDTEKNGGARQPVAGDFGGVQTFTRPLALQGTDFRWGGYWGYDLDLRNTPAIVRDCSFTDSKSIGIRIGAQPYTLQRITDCSFTRVRANWIRGINWDSLALCARNTASQGGLPIEVNPAMGAVTLDITTANLIGPLMTMRLSHQTPGGGTLNLHAGIHIKPLGRASLSSSYGSLNLLGTARDPIIISSFKDDSLDGDTNGDGSASKPLPGDWTGLQFLRTRTANRVEHCVVRYANWGIYCTNAQTKLDAVRADFCASNGFYFQSTTLPFTNLIAHANSKNGIYLNGGSSSILHATVHGSGGSGIEATPGHSGQIINSISWKNTGGNFVGLNSGKVKNSNGGFAGKNGNINKDPLFQMPGNMLLKTGSPCINAGDLTAGIATAKDFSENSRCNDWNFSGNALPDMGAREVSAVGLAVNRPHPVLGKTQAFWTYANSTTTGVSVFLLGFQDIRFYMAPFGMENVGLQNLMILGVKSFNQTLPFSIPQDPKLLGVKFAVQALGIPIGKPGKGTFTNLYRGTIRQ